MIRARASSLFVGITSALALPAIASAQFLSPWPFLPLELTPGVSLEERYTDNFFLTEKKKVEEFRTTLTPSLVLGMTTGRNRSDLHYQLGIAYSSVREDNPRLFNSLDGTDVLSLGDRLTLTIKDLLTQTDEPAVVDARGIERGPTRLSYNNATGTLRYAGDLHEGNLNLTHISNTREAEAVTGAPGTTTTSGTPGTRFESTVWTGGPGAKLSLGEIMLLDVSANYTHAEFQNTQLASTTTTTTTASRTRPNRISSFDGYQATGALTRELAAETRVGANGSYAVRTPQVGQQFTIMQGGLSLVRAFTRNVNGDFMGGYTIVQGAVQSSGFSGTGKLTYAGPNLSVTLEVSKTIRETFAQSQNAGLIDGRDAGVRVTYNPADRVSITGGARYTETTFLQPNIAASQGLTVQPTTSSAANQKSTIYTFNAGLRWDFLSRLSATLAYMYQHRFVDGATAVSTTTSGTLASTGRPGFYDSNTVTVGLTYTYDRR